MSTKLKSLLQQLLLSPRKFPVEFVLGLAFFVIAVTAYLSQRLTTANT